MTARSALALALLIAAVVAIAAAPNPTLDEAALFERASVSFQPVEPRLDRTDDPVLGARIELGQRLYLDPRLSKLGNVSCNSCHALDRFGVDNLPTSPGDDGLHGARNSPSVYNAALHVAQFWDGRAADVEQQAGMPILNPVEMAIPGEGFLVDRLRGLPEYPSLFAQAFPEEPEPLTYGNIGRAIGSFERTLVTPSRFDEYLLGDRHALDGREKVGLATFMDMGCTACHNGMTAGARAFRKFGLGTPYWELTGSHERDAGRFAVTGDEADRYVFKVASLRNVAQTGPYFHDGSVATLEDAIRIMAKLQVGVDLEPDQVDAIAAFLGSMTGAIPPAAREALERFGGARTPAP